MSVELIRRLLAVGCKTEDSVNCFYCGAFLSLGDDHGADCPYAEAKRLLGDPADGTAAVSVEEWLWANCRIVYFVPDGHYPLEHNPHAGKDMREAITSEAWRLAYDNRRRAVRKLK